MSLMPFSSRSSSRSSGGGDAGGEKKLSNRKYTISLSFSGLITSGIITIIAIGWIFAFGVIVGRGYNPEKKMPELARLLPPPEGQDAPKEAKGILKPEELTFMTDLKQTQPAANAAPNKPEAKAANPTAQPVAAATPKPEAASAEFGLNFTEVKKMLPFSTRNSTNCCRKENNLEIRLQSWERVDIMGLTH